jgi:hypothetical protein
VDNLTPVGRIVVWTLLAVGSALFLTYLPSAFGLVANANGRFIGRTLFFPVLVVSLVSGVFYTKSRRRLAYWIVGVMLTTLVLLELRVI